MVPQMKYSSHISWLCVFLFLCVLTVVKVRRIQQAQNAAAPDPADQWNGRRVDLGLQKSRHKQIEHEVAMLGGKFHKPLKSFLDFPGIDTPPLCSVDDAGLVDATPVVD